MIQNILSENPWFVKSILSLIVLLSFLLAIKLITEIFGEHVREFFHFLKAEFKEMINGEVTLGSLNMKCLFFITFFGVLIVCALEVKMVLGYVSIWMGTEKAEYLQHSANLPALFYFLGVIGILSVIAVMADQIFKRK